MLDVGAMWKNETDQLDIDQLDVGAMWKNETDQ